MAEGRKCYEILGLKHGASEDEIKKAYKKLALQFHPDKNDSEDAKRKFQEIVYAYKYLTEGRDSFTTFNPHDLKVPEEFFRNLFERSKHHFYSRGGFAFFFPDDDDHVYFDDGDYCYQSDSSDDDTYRSRTYNNHSGSSSTYQPTAKQLKRREKKRRQKERAKEKKQKEREEKMNSETVYTDDVTADKNQTDHSVPSRKQSLTSNDGDSKISNKSNQQTKLNKKDKKKLESEQRKREKEMKEIAEELMKKQEQDLAKLKEKEKQAARKLEEEEQSSFVPEFYAQKEKKSRKARQREKKRQDAAELQERLENARKGSTSASTVSASSVDSQSTQSNMASNNPGKLNQSTIKPSTQSKQTSMSNRHSSVKTDINKHTLSQKKPGVMGSRFDVLESLNSSGDSSDDLEPSTNKTFPSDHVYIDDEDDNDDESDDDEVDDKSDNDDEESCIDQKAQNFTDRGYSESSHQSGNRPSRGRPNFSQHQQGYAQTNNQYHDKMYREFSRSQGHGEYSRSPGHGQYGRSPGHGQYGRSPGCAPSFVPSCPSTNGFVRQSFNDQNFHPGFMGPNNHQYFRGPPPPQPRYPNGGYDRMRSPYPNPRFSHPDPRYGYPHNQRFRPENKYHAQFTPQRDRAYSGNGNASYHDVPYNNNFVRPGDQRNFAPHNSYPQHNRKFENDSKIGGKKHQHSSGHKSNQTSSATSKNMFQSHSDINNQVPSFKKDVLDSLDDIDDHTEFKDPVLKDQSSRLSDIDVGTDKFLSSEKLSVPEGMFNDKIKNYYKL